MKKPLKEFRVTGVNKDPSGCHWRAGVGPLGAKQGGCGVVVPVPLGQPDGSRIQHESAGELGAGGAEKGGGGGRKMRGGKAWDWQRRGNSWRKGEEAAKETRHKPNVNSANAAQLLGGRVSFRIYTPRNVAPAGTNAIHAEVTSAPIVRDAWAIIIKPNRLGISP